MSRAEPLRAVVLAGDRAGGSELARAHDEPAGVLVPLARKTLIEHVVAALRASELVEGGVIVGPESSVVRDSAALQGLLADGDFTWVAPATGPSQSALAGSAAVGRYPVLLTAGDHALLDPATVDRFVRDALACEADFVAGLVPYERVSAAFPETRRTVLRFADGARCGSNLFLIRTARGRRALELWRRFERQRKRPWRLVAGISPLVLARYLGGRLTCAAAFELLSARAACTIGHCRVGEPRAAIDVDTCADLRLAERLLSHG